MSQKDPPPNRHQKLGIVIRALTSLAYFVVAVLFLFPLCYFFGDGVIAGCRKEWAIRMKVIPEETRMPHEIFWTPPDLHSISDYSQRAMVEYGRELIAHTSRYLGPKGKVMQISNGMNCQNCHLEAGTKVFGNNYSAVASTYPKFRARSGAEEDIYKRVNDCIERSLNGKALDTLSREMQAIKAYITFLGSNVEKGVKPNGSGLKNLAYLNRPANPETGRHIYYNKCASCHMVNGDGLKSADGLEYTYPPLWGNHSFNDAAGLYRLSNFAKYVKVNMPLGASHLKPQLSDEEAWDVAAFVISQQHPHKETPHDWPDISKKPVDHPFGPYADTFSEHQHKLGPFPPILEAQKQGMLAQNK